MYLLIPKVKQTVNILCTPAHSPLLCFTNNISLIFWGKGNHIKFLGKDDSLKK